MNLYQYFENRWSEQPGWSADRVFISERATGRTFTYADLDRYTARLAFKLVSQFKLRPGDRVAAQVEKSPEAFFLYLSCLRAGLVFLPLNTAYQKAEVEFFLQDSEPRLFVVDPLKAEMLGEMSESTGLERVTLDSAGKGALTEGISELPDTFETHPVSESDLAAILYTSGTTGRSKGAMLSHRNLLSNADALVRAWGFTSQDRLLHALPIYHVHGLFISLHCVLSSGSQVLWLPKFDANEVIRGLAEATVFMGVPTYYTRMIENSELTRARCASVRLFISGSAPLRPETFEAFESLTGHRILERYGMTETGVISSCALSGERIPGSVGRAVSLTDIRISRESGMIEVRGPNVFEGYWRQPEKTESEFTQDGFFRTGDLGAMDSTGLLRIVGRAKDLVITGGFNVYPREVEIALDRHPEVLESAVFGVPHPDFGEAVVAAVVLKPEQLERKLNVAGVSEKMEKEMLELLRDQLAAFKIPKRIFFVSELPRNAMSKVQKNVLRDRYSKTFAFIK